MHNYSLWNTVLCHNQSRLNFNIQTMGIQFFLYNYLYICICFYFFTITYIYLALHGQQYFVCNLIFNTEVENMKLWFRELVTIQYWNVLKARTWIQVLFQVSHYLVSHCIIMERVGEEYEPKWKKKVLDFKQGKM